MAEERILWISKMSPEDQERCSTCSARDRYGLPPSLCRIAALEESLDKKPKLARQIAVGGIDMNSVPEDCPNGY